MKVGYKMKGTLNKPCCDRDVTIVKRGIPDVEEERQSIADPLKLTFWDIFFIALGGIGIVCAIVLKCVGGVIR